MTFREKIDKILKTNAFKINSVYGLEQYIGSGPGAIKKYYKKDGEPGRGTIRKIIEGVGLNPEWWETGKEPIYTENSTYVDLPTKKEKDPDEHIRILIKNLDRMGELNEYLLKELKRLQGG